MADDVQQRAARNEGLFREINEGIRRGGWPGEDESLNSFRCECASLGCTNMLTLSFREYERVRGHARRFIVTPGHERLDTEVVVETRPNYLVVQKVGEAGEAAAETNPRD